MIVVKAIKLSERLNPYLDRLPIFPLHRVQLFPRALLPLYVFEPRYREMTAACLERGGIMAVAALRPGFRQDYEGRPPVRPIAGLGKIVAHRLSQDGTYNILLRGLARVRITRELPPDCSYREVQARLLPDRSPRGYDLMAAHETLLLLTGRLAALVPQGGEALQALCQSERRPGRLADILAAALLTNPRQRRRLLETSDVAVRIEQMTSEVARMVARYQRHTDFGAN